MSNPKQTTEAAGTQECDALDTTGKPYFSRTLRVLDQANKTLIRDSELLAIQRPIVILGEPGMGKSEMIRYLGARAGAPTISASRFMHSKNVGTLVQAGQPLLIDALDEALARSEGEAVDKVLANLEAAGSPRFILSCRAREWQSRTQVGLEEIYGASPLVVSIEALTRAQAREFWVTRGFLNDAEPVLARMDEQNLSDLYQNPLTLTLLGSVADNGGALPATRASLFDRVCELSWRESHETRQDAPLAKLSRDQALSAAGAMMASVIFAGAEAISLTGSGFAQDGDLPIPEIEALPGARHARAVISSKLLRLSE